MRVKYSTLATVIVLVTSIVITFSFFNYSVITEEGISIHNSPFEEKDYSWNDVAQASVQYHYGYKNKISIEYLLSMNDGRDINLLHSVEFFSKIIMLGYYFEHKGVKIVHMEVDNEVYKDLKNQFSGPSKTGIKDRFQDVIVKLLDIT